MNKTESMVLAEVLDQTRKLAYFYIQKFKVLEPEALLKEFEIDGKKFNCVIWELAHMAWAESSLILGALAGIRPDAEWIRRFHLGSKATPQPDWPTLQEVLAAMETIHKRSLEILNQLDDEVLNEPFIVKVTNWNTDKRHVIMHAIRHEGTHMGHLSWLCKMHGIQTI